MTIRWIVSTVSALLFLSTATAGMADGEAADTTPAAGEQSAADYVLGTVSQLGYARFDTLAKYLEIDKALPTSFYGCLCSAGAIMGSGVGFHPEPWGDCQNTLPCKGGNWGCVAYELPSDASLWHRCLAEHSPEGLALILKVVGALSAQKPQSQPPLHPVASEPDGRYKKLCDAAFVSFPVAAPRVQKDGTGMLWDDKTIMQSFADAVKAYQTGHAAGEPDNLIGTNNHMGSAEGYGLWLFGHGQDLLGGPQVAKSEAANAVRLDEVRKMLAESRDELQQVKERYSKRFEKNSPSQKDMETYFRQVAKLENRLSKLETERYRLTGRRESVAVGTEMALLDSIKTLKGQKPNGEKLTPGDVLLLALKQTDGNVNQALLLSHNTLRALARPGEGDFGVTGVKEKREFFDETFVRLREGDNSGPFYHLFGTAFFAYQQRAENQIVPQAIGSELANQAEQWFREYNPGGAQAPDPVKYCYNYWGAAAGSALYDLAEGPARSVAK